MARPLHPLAAVTMLTAGSSRVRGLSSSVLVNTASCGTGAAGHAGAWLPW